MSLASVLEQPVADVGVMLADLAADYAEQHRGFKLRQVAGGWRFFSRHEYAGVVERFVLDGQPARLTQASLETLAIVAYRQPVVGLEGRGRPWGQRRRRDAHAAQPWSGRGDGARRRDDRRPLRDDHLFPAADRAAELDDLPALAPYLPEVDALDELGVGGRG